MPCTIVSASILGRNAVARFCFKTYTTLKYCVFAVKKTQENCGNHTKIEIYRKNCAFYAVSSTNLYKAKKIFSGSNHDNSMASS